MDRSDARSPWLAVVLSTFVWPGLGQLYNGRLGRALLVLVALPLGYTAALLAVLRVGPTLPLLALVHLLAAAAWAAASWDAFRDAQRADARRPWFSTWYVLAAVAVAALCVLVPTWTVVFMKTNTPAYKMPTGSMEQTLLRGDHFLADATAYGYRLPLQVTPSLMRRPPSRGDLAVFRYPPNPSQHFVKRVIGLPGETVEIRGRTVYIDGGALVEPYASFLEIPDEVREDRSWGPEVVPPEQYWMLGDNRDNSKDSRYWGFLPESELIGRAGVVYFSIEQSRIEVAGRAGSGRIRWDRLGHVPR